MAVQIECLNMIIPITVIEKKYPGGWKQYQHDNEFNAAESDDNFTDGELLRLGAMNSFSIYLIVSEWEDLGLKGYVRAGKKKKWRDFCLCNAFDLSLIHISEPTRPY